ncbi:gamma-glutamylcyclotransferase family protein [Noviherbaspirillum sp.]|uniref:gamma-glutamylcyclotransferase family protein n=1 Tax=Noviherbaspirillum sp. TaxID=1926288 RepID=UPI002B498FAC|nr:gamma-glutamylcyclotransferase family protein [Noviherbaspirillum sp.]
MHVFTYGSLMFPEVWTRVVRGACRSAPARLDGFARFEIHGETYPGMVPMTGDSVSGVLYFDVADEDVAALDAFEGEEYRRDTVNVVLESGEALAAGAYVYLLPQKLSESPWRPGAFRMERFIETYCRDKLGE